MGASWAIKVQYGILAILVLALGSFLCGRDSGRLGGDAARESAPGISSGERVLRHVCALFPGRDRDHGRGKHVGRSAQSGASRFRAGRWPRSGLPRWFIWRWRSSSAPPRPRSALLEKPLVILEVAKSPLLINAGIFAATLSSALGSMMGAPRILQALARDEIFPRLRPLARGSGASNEPRRATILTLVIAQVAIVFGDLNAIAPIITMFFMVTYGTINLACFYESATRNPSYRPSFKLSHWSTRAPWRDWLCGGDAIARSDLGVRRDRRDGAFEMVDRAQGNPRSMGRCAQRFCFRAGAARAPQAGGDALSPKELATDGACLERRRLAAQSPRAIRFVADRGPRHPDSRAGHG